MHQALPPFSAYVGAKRPKLLLIGEAWGANEDLMKQPFVGWSGKELFKMLGEAFPEIEPELHASIRDYFKYDLAWITKRGPWLEAAGIGMTNVLALRPPDNKLEALCCAKKDLPEGVYRTFPAISRALYLRPEFMPELTRLYSEVAECKPNLIVALGNVALWAIMGVTNIGSVRGAVTIQRAFGWFGRGTSDVPPIKVLPTYHPAAVMRQWAWRPVVVADLEKAARECNFPELRLPFRRVLINPSIEEVEQWTTNVLSASPSLLSADIETGLGQIKCISFAVSSNEAICVPFWDTRIPGGSYWPSADQELRAWKCVKALLENSLPKLGQNFVYDLQYLSRMGIRAQNCIEDTMLLHHSMFSEIQKGLGFLGSIYTNEQSWKLMRRARPDTEKRDE